MTFSSKPSLHAAGLVVIGAVVGSIVTLIVVLVVSPWVSGNGQLSRAGNQSASTVLNNPSGSGTLGQGSDGPLQSSVASRYEELETEWEALVNGQSNIAQIEILLQHAQTWLDQDGIKVIDQISRTLSDTTVHDAVIASVLQDIAQSDPQTALQQALDLKGVARQFALQTIIEIWATTDPQAALAGVSILESRTDQQALQESVLSVWARVDPRGLLDAIEALPIELQALGTEMALLAISKEAPQEAIQLMADLTDKDLIDKLSKEIALHWSEQDAHAALDWVLASEFPTNVIQAEALMIVLANLASEDPELAFQTAREQPIVLRGQFYRGLEVTVIQHLVETDIDAAKAMLSQIRNEGLTVAHAYSEVGRAYIRNGEFDQALKLGERLSERGQRNYYGSLMYQWALSNPESLFAALEGLPSDQMKKQAARGLVRYNPETYALSDEQMEQVGTFLPEGYQDPSRRYNTLRLQAAQIQRVPTDTIWVRTE